MMIYIYERGVPGGALNRNSTSYPAHGHYGDLPLQGKIPTAELGIEPGTSRLIVRSSDLQATRLVEMDVIYQYIKLCETQTLIFTHFYIN
jgi:hypothetical protein